MKILFDHVLGSHEQAWSQVSVITAIIEPHEERMALETGWLYFDGWYQTRSVRIKTAGYKGKKPWPKGYTFNVVPYESLDQAAIEALYLNYCRHKGFCAHGSPLLNDRHNSKYGLVYNREHRLVAYTKFIHHVGGIESTQFCWDYSEPRISLGVAIQEIECQYAEALGFDYIYIGPGYETGCLYKANFPGFEWWTGTTWSTDRELYRRLCHRDSLIRSSVNFSRIDQIINESVNGVAGGNLTCNQKQI